MKSTGIRFPDEPQWPNPKSGHQDSRTTCPISFGMRRPAYWVHYNDIIMGSRASHITTLTIVYSSVYSGADQRKHQCSATLAFLREIHRWPVNSPHKGPVTRKMFPFDDVIMGSLCFSSRHTVQGHIVTKMTNWKTCFPLCQTYKPINILN